ncbi:MAG: hypothetical protein ACSW79_07580, partial [Eubacteriales bacterium]
NLFYHKQEAEATLLGRLDFLFFSGCFATAPFSCFSGKNQANTWKTETRSGFGAAARLHRIFFVKISPRGACEKCSACDTV